MTDPEVKKARVEAPQLLPGIPDEITFEHISPKLPMRAIQVLSSVSCAWRDAIRTREVHHARLRAQSTETFVLIRHSLPAFDCACVMGLYSLRHNLAYELPAVPSPICINCKLSSDGKVYVRPNARDDEGVFVLDLAGQWKWLYQEQHAHIEDSDSQAVYDPVTGVWKTPDEFPKGQWLTQPTMFVAQGQFYAIIDDRIEVYDTERKSWTALYLNAFESLGLFATLCLLGVAAVEDELLAVVYQWRMQDGAEVYLARSKGFGATNTSIVWEKIDCCLSFTNIPLALQKFSSILRENLERSPNLPPGIQEVLINPVQL